MHHIQKSWLQKNKNEWGCNLVTVIKLTVFNPKNVLDDKSVNVRMFLYFNNKRKHIVNRSNKDV